MNIKIKNLTKRFKKIEVLKNVNMSLTDGNIYGFYGRNGSGKSVLLKLIANLYSPSEGTILFNDKVIDFYKACTSNDIKPIIGLEINVDDLIIVLYAENYDGYKNLIKLSTILSERKITLDDLTKYSSSTVCIMPYESKAIYNDLKKIFQHLFIGYKNINQKNKIRSSNKVYFNKILCLQKEDEVYLKYLYAIRDGKRATEVIIEDEEVSLLPLKNKEENTNYQINDLCNLEIPFHQDLMPIYKEAKDSFDYLKKECIKGLKRIFGNTAPKKYAIRLKHELDVIKKMGFCDYFLIVADYINFAKKEGILVGPGRGSAAGSLVAYLLDITTVDPLKYNLLFERFLNEERISMPDIDVDFEDTRRDEVSEYCIRKYYYFWYFRCETSSKRCWPRFRDRY